MIKSFKQMKEILGAATLNTGNVLNAQIGGDNLALFATNHPVDGYTVPNTPTVQVGLNDSGVQASHLSIAGRVISVPGITTAGDTTGHGTFMASVIAGASTPEQVKANAKAVGWAMSAEELADIDAITRA